MVEWTRRGVVWMVVSIVRIAFVAVPVPVFVPVPVPVPFPVPVFVLDYSVDYFFGSVPGSVPVFVLDYFLGSGSVFVVVVA